MKCSIRDNSHFSEENFLHDLLQIDWQTLISEREPNVDKLFSVLYTTLNKVINKHAPFKTISKRKMKEMSKPGITNGIFMSLECNRLVSILPASISSAILQVVCICNLFIVIVNK